MDTPGIIIFLLFGLGLRASLVATLDVRPRRLNLRLRHPATGLIDARVGLRCQKRPRFIACRSSLNNALRRFDAAGPGLVFEAGHALNCLGNSAERSLPADHGVMSAEIPIAANKPICMSL